MDSTVSKRCCGPLHKGALLSPTEFGNSQKCCRACSHVYYQKRYAAIGDKMKANKREWAKANPDAVKEYNKNWAATHKDRVKTAQKKFYSKPENKVPHCLIRAVNRSFGFNIGKDEFEYWFGCTIDQYLAHIQSLFTPGMSWVNHGSGKRYWEIDHIVPLCSVKLCLTEDIKRVLHYTNTRPLWSKMNRVKGASSDKFYPRLAA